MTGSLNMTMRTSLQQRVMQTIECHRMLAPGESVGVAVSAGADSVALLLLLIELRDRLGVRLLALHFNHQLRGSASDADENFAANLASQYGLEFICSRQDVAAQARQHGWNLEDAARRLRYEFFGVAVNSGRATRVAVAHTRDDQAETLLAHLLRGTGPTGLGAIYPVAGSVVRPLLDVRRQELRRYLRDRGQSWCEDRTNEDTTRLRARIRHLLLPMLERDFQPAIVDHLSRLAALAREDEAFWTALMEDCFHTLVERTEDGFAIPIAHLLAPLSLSSPSPAAAERPLTAPAKRLVRRIIEELKGDRRQLTSRHVEQVMHLATACASGHRTELMAGVIVERTFDRLLFSRTPSARPGDSATKSAARAYQYRVEFAGGSSAISIPEISRRFSLKVIDWPPTESDTRVALDADRLRAPLILRSWRPGDSYRPRGRQHARKLKRLLLERRVGVRERMGWPVLTSGGTLAWARGLPVAADFAPRADTKAGLVIAEEAL